MQFRYRSTYAIPPVW
ncbi:hypothetical protein [Subdoligranulum variabile]